MTPTLSTLFGGGVAPAFCSFCLALALLSFCANTKRNLCKDGGCSPDMSQANPSPANVPMMPIVPLQIAARLAVLWAAAICLSDSRRSHSWVASLSPRLPTAWSPCQSARVLSSICFRSAFSHSASSLAQFRSASAFFSAMNSGGPTAEKFLFISDEANEVSREQGQLP